MQFSPAQTTVQYTLDATLHTVHGTFALKSGTVYFNPATGAIKGEILIDATTGQSGNKDRDSKMHKEVLESARYPETTFLPEQIEGKVEPQGKSTIQVQGMFGVHGATHKIVIPLQVEMSQAHWSATAHFSIPYVDWGMKNPSNFLLRVGKSVDIEVHSSGTIPSAPSTK